MKSLIITMVLAVLVVGGLGVWYMHLHSLETFGTAPAGSTFGDAKMAAVTINLANPGTNATSSSVLNTSSNDWYITSEEVACEGVGTSKTAYTGAGLASLTITAATSSTAAPATNPNTNTLPVVTVATATPNFVISSSTAATPGNNLVTNIWPSGSYLAFFANATNTAACTIGVRYISS